MRMRGSTTRAFATAVAFAAVLLGTAAAAAADSNEPAPPAQLLLPGESLHSDLFLPPARVDVSPWLKVSGIRQSCAVARCSRTASLAHVLQLTVTAPDGAAWTRPLDGLHAALPLPGGVVASDHSRTYELTLTMPAAADNRYEDLAMSATLRWYEQGVGGRHVGGSGSHKVTTRVLGEKTTRTSPGPVDDSLPFTGFDLGMVLLAATSLIAAGAVLLTGTRPFGR